MSELVPHKGYCDYWAVRPTLEGAIVGRLDGLSCSATLDKTILTYIIHISLTRDVLIAPEWGSDLSLICELDGVLFRGRE